MQKAGHRQLVYFLETNCFLNKQQHRFRSNKSNGSAIFTFMKDIFESVRISSVTSSVFIDNERPFDTIDHKM